jgi:hypothetical protein
MTDQEKIIAYDLDAAGIEERAKVCVDLVQTKAELAEASKTIESSEKIVRAMAKSLLKIESVCKRASRWGDDDHGYTEEISCIVTECFAEIGKR